MKKYFFAFSFPILFVLTACGETAFENGRYYVSKDPAACKTAVFQCEAGAKSFSDETGCGCFPAEPEGGESGGQPARHYLSKDPEACKTNDFACGEGSFVFADETGCGCQDAK